jgi:sterol desaturase/sphingolipid hydroxylase (fatty acid hydroxylase superfamily)
MTILYDAIELLRTMPIWEATIWLTAVNVAMFAVAVVVGEALIRRFEANRVSPRPPQVTNKELVLAIGCVAINALVAVAGVVLWREGLIALRPYGEYGAFTVLLDAFVLFIAMDFLMYLFHRVAHHPLLFPIAHSTHHEYENPQPLTLFVLNPIEAMGFGGLWLLVLIAYSASVEGILIYLAFNLAFGLVGHLGVEPAPERWIRLPVLRYISTSTFHAEHHMDRGYNFGFYLLVWDRLFGTISPDYAAEFSRVSGARTSASVPAR